MREDLFLNLSVLRSPSHLFPNTPLNQDYFM